MTDGNGTFIGPKVLEPVDCGFPPITQTDEVLFPFGAFIRYYDDGLVIDTRELGPSHILGGSPSGCYVDNPSYSCTGTRAASLPFKPGLQQFGPSPCTSALVLRLCGISCDDGIDGPTNDQTGLWVLQGTSVPPPTDSYNIRVQARWFRL